MLRAALIPKARIGGGASLASRLLTTPWAGRAGPARIGSTTLFQLAGRGDPARVRSSALFRDKRPKLPEDSHGPLPRANLAGSMSLSARRKALCRRVGEERGEKRYDEEPSSAQHTMLLPGGWSAKPGLAAPAPSKVESANCAR